MKVYKAVYENGKVIFKEKPKVKRGNVLVTFLDYKEKEDKIEFPSRKLGQIKEFNREDLYNDYLSHRY